MADLWPPGMPDPTMLGPTRKTERAALLALARELRK